MKRILLALLFACLGGPSLAFADPLNLNSESGFLFDFYPSSSAYMSNGSIDAYDGCYSLTVDGTAFNAGGAYDDWYDGRGFRTRQHDMGTLVTQRFGYVPEIGLSFARYIDVVQNTGGADQVVTFSYYCNLGSDGGETNYTSDGDDSLETTDTWARTDDVDNGGDPSLGHVFFGEGGDQGLTTMSYGFGSITWTYDVTIPAGGQAAIMIFGIQEQTRALAEEAAAALALLQNEALDAVDDEINDVVNFPIGPADGPRLRANGPYSVVEGGTVQLGVEITDPNGDVVTWSWDLDGDGVFGDEPNVANPVIDAADLDGPGSLRVGIRMTDGTNTVDRNVSVTVVNVAPAVSSIPVTDATTGELYEYTITATDVPADTISYSIDEGPAGMTVNGAGVVSWTPRADGRGPQIPVTVLVTDEDGGETEHTWMIDMHGGPIVVPGGPYSVDEGGDVLLAPEISDPEGDPLVYAWDLDSDNQYDDEDEPTATWSAAGIDGPAEGFVVHLLVSDGTHDIISDIPVEVRNAPPIFVSAPASGARVDRPWSYVVQCIDPGDDPFELTVDEEDLPLGMVWDALAATLSWVPNAGHLLAGDPPGTFQFTITAEDEDRGRSRQDVTITVGENTPPPVPPLKYPNDETVRTPQPTILLDNVEDADGDAVQYFVEVDYDPCFCSAEHMASGALEQGDLVTSWELPRPLNVDLSSGGHDQFYTRRWSSDGLDESEKELGIFHYAPPEEGDGDADADSDADADGDLDGDADGDDDDDGASCACRAAGLGAAPSDGLALFAALGLAGALVLRSRRRRPAP